MKPTSPRKLALRSVPELCMAVRHVDDVHMTVLVVEEPVIVVLEEVAAHEDVKSASAVVERKPLVAAPVAPLRPVHGGLSAKPLSALALGLEADDGACF